MKKIIFGLVLGILLLFGLISMVSACRDADAEFTLKIKTDIDLSKLIATCSANTCTSSNGYVTLISQYDTRVAVIVGDNLNDFGNEFEGLIIRLPYDLDDSSNPIISTINPEEFNWKEASKTDLNFLNGLEVVNLSDTEIDAISELSRSVVMIKKCEEGWRTMCKSEEGLPSPTCMNNNLIMITLPLNKLGTNINPDKNGTNKIYYWIFGLVIVIVLIMLFLVLRRKNR